MAAKAKRKQRRRQQHAPAAAPKKKAPQAAVAQAAAAEPAEKAPPKPTKRLERRALETRATREKQPHKLDIRYGVVRPKPIWAPFPLTEIATFIGIVMVAIGFVMGGDGSAAGLIGGGSMILAVAIGEMCLREHFAGFKSHSTLLAALPVVAITGLVYFLITDSFRGPIVLFVDATVFGFLFLLLHQKFRSTEAQAQAQARAAKKRR